MQGQYLISQIHLNYHSLIIAENQLSPLDNGESVSLFSSVLKMNHLNIEFERAITPLITLAEHDRRRQIRNQLHDYWTQFLLQPNTQINIKLWILRMNRLLAFYEKTAYSDPIMNSKMIFLSEGEKTDYYWFKFVVKRLRNKLKLLSRP